MPPSLPTQTLDSCSVGQNTYNTTMFLAEINEFFHAVNLCYSWIANLSRKKNFSREDHEFFNECFAKKLANGIYKFRNDENKKIFTKVPKIQQSVFCINTETKKFDLSWEFKIKIHMVWNLLLSKLRELKNKFLAIITHLEVIIFLNFFFQIRSFFLYLPVAYRATHKK